MSSSPVPEEKITADNEDSVDTSDKTSEPQDGEDSNDSKTVTKETEEESPSKSTDSQANKKEQSLKEQLEEDWAEDDSQDPTDLQTDKTTKEEDVPDITNQEDPVDPEAPPEQIADSLTSSAESSLVAATGDTTTQEAIIDPGLDTSIDTTLATVIDSALANITNSSLETADSVTSSEVLPTTNDAILSTGIDSNFTTPLDAALDSTIAANIGTTIDSNTEAAFDTIIDSALATAVSASMPTVSESEADPTSMETDTPEVKPDTTESTISSDLPANLTDEAKTAPNEVVKSEEKGEGGEKGSRKMRMHLTTQMMQKLIQEGNMEKLPNGSYKIKAEALKELQSNLPKGDEDEDDPEEDEEEEEDEDEEEEDEEENEADLDTSFTKSVPNAEVKADHKEEEEEPMETDEAAPDDTKMDDATNEATKEIVESSTKKRSASPEAQPERKNKQMKFSQDYVSDFNSSEDDEESAFSVLRENIKSMLPRKNRTLSKGISFLEEVHSHLFPQDVSSDSLSDLSDSDLEPIKSDFSPKSNGSDSKKKLCPGTSSIEAKLGIDGSSTLRINATGQVKEVQGKEFDVYHITTTTDGSSTSTTPLMIPRPKGTKSSPIKRKKPDGSLLLYHQPHVKLEPDDPDVVESYEDKKSKLRKYKQQMKLLRLRYMQLVQERMSKPGFNTLADLVNASSRFLSEDQLLFTTMQLKAGCLNTQGMRWSPREKILALGIYHQNPTQYESLRQMFHLPNKTVLERWLDSVAKSNPIHAKKLMYHIYTKYSFKPLK